MGLSKSTLMAPNHHKVQQEIIIRNWDGKFIQTSAFDLGASSVLILEGMAMRNGL